MRDPYDDQLRAARYRAERDQAREELARIDGGAQAANRTYGALSDEDRRILWWVHARGGLREIKRQRKKSVPREVYERKRAAWRCHIRECEEALRKRNRRIKELERAALERRTVRVEDREAAEWVRDHGGLDVVETRWHNDTQLADAVIYALWPYGMPDGGGNEDVMDELRKRLMPERYGWPRFEDGEFVKLKDDVADEDGNQCQVYSILFNITGDALIDAISDSSNEPILISARDGARVKRPAPEALDACGMPISRGMDVWWICEGDGRGVHAERLRVMRVFDDGTLDLKPYGPGTSLQLESTEVYVEKPVPAFDGRPLRVGDTVYNVESGTKYEVCEVKLPRVTVEYLAAGIPAHSSIVPYLLTHERPDSWERLEEDADKSPCEYYEIDASTPCKDCPAYMKESPDGDKPIGCRYEQKRDLVRRARALADRSEK